MKRTVTFGLNQPHTGRVNAQVGMLKFISG